MESYSALLKVYENGLKETKEAVLGSCLGGEVKRKYLERIEHWEEKISSLRESDYVTLTEIKRYKVDIIYLMGTIQRDIDDLSKSANKSITHTSNIRAAIVDFLVGFGLLHDKD